MCTLLLLQTMLPTFFLDYPFAHPRCAKMCLEVPRHILVLPIHTLSHVMHVLGLERILLDHYKPTTCITWSKVCLIVYKKWIKQRVANKKKKRRWHFCTACNNNYVHIWCWGTSISRVLYYIFQPFLDVDLCYSVNISHPGKAFIHIMSSDFCKFGPHIVMVDRDLSNYNLVGPISPNFGDLLSLTSLWVNFVHNFS
jgi:hypothetical protein